MPLKQVDGLIKPFTVARVVAFISGAERFYKFFHYVQDVRKASMALKVLTSL